MPVNNNKPLKWKADIAQSVDLYNSIQKAQEMRQLGMIKAWLEAHGYTQISSDESFHVDEMPFGTFSFCVNMPAKHKSGRQNTSVPINAVIMPKGTKARELPLFFETQLLAT